MADNAKTGIVITAEDRSKGAFDSAQRNIASLGSVVNNLTASFGGLSALVGGLGVTAFAAMIKSSADFGGKLNDMAMQTGATVEQLSGLRDVAELSGVSLDTAGKGLQKLSKNMLDAATGGKESSAIFQALGVSVADSSGNLRDSGKVMEGVAKAIASLQSPTERVAAAQLVFGKSGADLVPMLMDIAKGGELVATWTAKDAALADDFGDNLTRLQQHVRGTGESITRHLLPSLVELSSRLDQAFKPGLVEGFASRWGASFKGMAAGIAEGLASADEFLGKITTGETSERHYRQAIEHRAGANKLYQEMAKLASQNTSPAAAPDVNSGALAKAISAAEAGGKTPRRDTFGDLMMETSGLNKDFYKDLDALNTGYRQGRAGLDEYRTAVEQLVAKQPFAIAMVREEKDAREAQIKVYERAADAEGHIAKAMGEFAAANQQQLIGIQSEIDAIGATPEQIERVRQLAQVARDLAKAIEQVKAETAKTGDIEGEASRIYELFRQADQAKKDIGVSLDAKNKDLLDYNANWMKGAKNSFDEYQRDAQNVAGQTQQLFTKAFQGMEDSLVSFVKTGKLDFKSLADSIIEDIIRIQVRQAIAQAMSSASGSGSWLGAVVSLVGAYFGNSSSAASGYMGTSGTSAVGSGTALTSSNYGIAHGGGIVGALSGSKFAAPSVFAGASRYHGGGLVDGEVPIIAKKGEGVFTPEQMKAMGGGTVNNISVAVDASGTKAQGDSAAGSDIGRKIGNAVRAVLIEEQRPGGLLSAA